MSSLEWDDLRIFLAVLRGRSVRSASKRLAVSHSTVSRRLAAMEERLGAKLFARQPDGFVPTPVGQQIVERAERVESEVISLEREVLGRDTRLSGPIRITMPLPVARYLLMPALADFAERYPDIVLEIANSYQLADLSRRSADIAIRFQAEPDEYLFGRRLPEFAESVYATQEYIENHRFRGAAPTASWIGWGEHNQLQKRIRESPFPNCPIKSHVSDPIAQAEAARNGLGMAMLPCIVGDQSRGLVRVPPGSLVAHRPAWVLTHPDLRTTERIRVCVRYLVEAIWKQEALVTGQGT